MNHILPNDIICKADYAIVIASFIYNEHDDSTDWGCLLMHDNRPYYQVANISCNDKKSQSFRYKLIDESRRFDNINEAIKEYNQWGGDI